MAGSPTFTDSEDPISIIVSIFSLFTRRTAKSVNKSLPNNSASRLVSSSKTTSSISAPSTTWWFVTIYAYSSSCLYITPEPVPASLVSPCCQKSERVCIFVTPTTAGETLSTTSVICVETLTLTCSCLIPPSVVDCSSSSSFTAILFPVKLGYTTNISSTPTAS